MTVSVVLAVAAAVCAVSLCLTGCLLMLIAASKPKEVTASKTHSVTHGKPLTSEDYARLIEAESKSRMNH